MYTKVIYHFFIFCIISILLTSCNDDEVSSIPVYPVSLKLNLSGQYSNFRNSSNQYLMFTERVLETDNIGFGGVLVYSSPWLDEAGKTQYFAFDMSCANEVRTDVRVYPLADKLGQVQCELCGSVYDISMGLGIPISGPSKHILRKFGTTVDGDYLYVYRLRNLTSN